MAGVKRHPLRRVLEGVGHPDGLIGARRELAAALGCHPDSIRNIDSGYRNPHREFAKRIQAEVWRLWRKVVRAADLVFYAPEGRAA